MTFRLKAAILAVVLLVPFSAHPQSSFILRPEFSAHASGDPYNLSKRVSKRPMVGLVLSGGGARGIAHIGTLKALERHGIPIDFIAGNSMGAIVGGLYAAGYSTAELESVAVNTNWTDVLTLTEDTRRSELYLDQKQAQEHSFLLLRLDGLEPVIPSSISSGQRLTNFLTELTFQALYHPETSFDDLKIPFRAVATDLISGRRAVLGSGSLAEALRATVTVPLLFTPLKRDGMELVDGGLVSNAPVDVAKEAGCDIVISSNTTSMMRPPGQLGAPWETADQIMTIMMQASNEKQFGMADIVMTPDLGNHLSSEFSGVDSLIRRGEEETERFIDTIKALIAARRNALASRPAGDNHIDPRSLLAPDAAPLFQGDEFPPDLRESILREFEKGPRAIRDIEAELEQAYATGKYADVYAEVVGNLSHPSVVYHARLNPVLKAVRFQGNTLVASRIIQDIFDPLIGKPVNSGEIRNAIERTLRLYRKNQCSLARLDSLRFDESRNTLHFLVNEGLIRRVAVEGNNYTEDYVIRREFPQDDGDLFNVRRAQQGVININSTGLFEYVLLDVAYESARPVVVIKVAEKSTNNLRVGLHVDNERGLQGLADLRDANLFGSGAELGFTFGTSPRNRLARLEYHANRIFNTILTFNLRAFYRHDDVYAYTDVPSTSETRWERFAEGEYRQVRYGGTLAFGTQLERLGNITTEFRVENQEIRYLSGTGYTPDRYKLVSAKLGTTIDTENRFPFPTSGMMLTVSFESALQQLGSHVSFAKFTMSYESYATVFQNHTFRPRITIGVADATLPLAEQFSLGGLDSFFGLREDDSRGRQLFLVNAEYRFQFPFKIIFDTFLKIRYDVGMISSLPEEISFGKFHHGIGAEFAVDTPVGPASIGAGRSFFLRRDLRDNPLSVGPILFYFSVGYRM